MNELERSARAKELLENPVFKEAFSAVRNELISGIETCPIGDVDMQHDLTLSLQLMKRIRGKLERWVEDGKLESKKIEQEGLMERMRQRLRA